MVRCTMKVQPAGFGVWTGKVLQRFWFGTDHKVFRPSQYAQYLKYMAVPKLISTTAQNETFGGVTYHIEGELVPALQIELSATGVYFEHHILLWKDPAVEIALHPMKGAFKRMLAGMPFMLTGASGPGRIAFSRDGAGHVFGLHLKPGTSIDVREHQWLAATDDVDYTFKRVKGVANILMGGTGFFIDTFSCSNREGILWLHGFGNVFEVTLAPGEQIDIEPGGWIYKEHSVQMQTNFQKLTTGLFASAGQIVFNRFTGPGKVALQSMYAHMEGGE
jgi:uncharacterized protein (AIM24 family)